MLKKILIGNGVFVPNLEGPYVVTGVVRPGTFRHSSEEEILLPCPWNANHLKKLYPKRKKLINVSTFIFTFPRNATHEHFKFFSLRAFLFGNERLESMGAFLHITIQKIATYSTLAALGLMSLQL